MSGESWADMADSPARDSPVVRESPIRTPEVDEARRAVDKAQAALRLIDIIADPAAHAAALTVLTDSATRFRQISETAEANRVAAADAARVTPPPAQPEYRADRATDAVIRAAVARATYDINLQLTELKEQLAGRPLEGGGRSIEGPSSKHPSSPPKFNGTKGSGRLTIEAWLLQFVDWCDLHAIPAPKRVLYAIQALEGEAVQNWYNLKRVLLADNKDPNNWDTFKSGMLAGYAEVSPDIYVRTHLSKLRQGAGSVQTYYDKFTAVLSQADKYPVLGAEAVWHFKQGLSERIRTAIAGSSDEDLHAVAVQAKRVDAELNLHTSTPAHVSAPPKASSPAPAAGKRGATAPAGVTFKKAKAGASDPLVAYRVSKGVCTNCGVEKAHHKGLMGTSCTAAHVAPSYAEMADMAKGKGKA